MHPRKGGGQGGWDSEREREREIDPGSVVTHPLALLDN